MKSKSGFTIVELLIVIVVIAILAAITIVAFNGVQNRAKNTQTVQAVTQWARILKMYRVENDGYPTQTSCLGTGYGRGLSGTDATGGQCRQDTSTGGGIDENTTFEASLAKYVPNGIGPTPAFVTVNDASGYPYYRGAYFYPYYVSGGTVSPARIDFALVGTTTCPNIAGLDMAGPQTWPNGIKCSARFTE